MRKQQLLLIRSRHLLIVGPQLWILLGIHQDQDPREDVLDIDDPWR